MTRTSCGYTPPLPSRPSTSLLSLQCTPGVVCNGCISRVSTRAAPNSPLPPRVMCHPYAPEERDKDRLEELRDLNRATLKATGEQMSEEEIDELRPSRYLDRREFKDDD